MRRKKLMTAPKTLKKNPSLRPQNIDGHTWYYEYKGHIYVVRQVVVGGKIIRTDQIRIPKYRLKRSLDRMG